ncbi:hypothetical protein DERP_001129 [Dermatophagoides pteronyssinus]|uniref:Uncharacterized protein n=1 Tax=Dermatophagoides pteronyssinus TaxID=6956 RepID=A0ABQ8JDL6_DERPT|nr:hypothetical protein DERP_001129 [Dermatophagoides pteronyssinus]
MNHLIEYILGYLFFRLIIFSNDFFDCDNADRLVVIFNIFDNDEIRSSPSLFSVSLFLLRFNHSRRIRPCICGDNNKNECNVIRPSLIDCIICSSFLVAVEKNARSSFQQQQQQQNHTNDSEFVQNCAMIMMTQ